MRASNPYRRGGFTLVEVALAVVVVAVGIMAAFALIQSGLDSSQKALSDTRAAIFADDVFNGLRSKSSLALESTNDAAWRKFWTSFTSTTVSRTNITVAAGHVWQRNRYGGPFSPPVYLRVYNTVVPPRYEPYTINFTNMDLRTGLATPIANHAIRYELLARPKTQTLRMGDGTMYTRTNAVEAVLKVWEGQYANVSLSNALVFTSEFVNTGGL